MFELRGPAELGLRQPGVLRKLVIGEGEKKVGVQPRWAVVVAGDVIFFWFCFWPLGAGDAFPALALTQGSCQ